jgi:plastocyanin
VKAGQTITVTNKDSVAHTLTDRNGAFNTGAIQGGGSTTFVAPSMAGSYQLKCTFHPSMSGTLVVTP